MRGNLEPMRNSTGKFLNLTWILPSSKACSISSQLRLRLWTTSETSDWSPQLAIPGVWPSVSTPVDTSPLPDSRSKFGITCKIEDNKPLPQKQIHNVDKRESNSQEQPWEIFFQKPLSGHPPPKWEQQLQTRIKTESIRSVPEISGRTTQ